MSATLPVLVFDENAVARAMHRVARWHPWRVDDATEDLPTLFAAVVFELGLDPVHPFEGLDCIAMTLLRYVQQTGSTKLLWSYRVENATRPVFWRSYDWHVRHRPWLVECS